MDSPTFLSSVTFLSRDQKAWLQKGDYTTLEAVVYDGIPTFIAKKCRVSVVEAKRVLELVKTHFNASFDLRKGGSHKQIGIFTTGDKELDSVIGGGIRTGMLWEVVGESAAGKSQLALQLSLLVQLPQELMGLSGSTCFLTTSSILLPTNRLVQICNAHPLLSPELCGLDDVHTLPTPTIPKLLFTLTQVLPKFIESRAANERQKPVKLVVLDALGELFHLSDKTSAMTLTERSKSIAEIASCLHHIASHYDIAILVLNEVVDVFDHSNEPDPSNANAFDLVYGDQVRWFARSNTVVGENRKEASLGLVWANQVNARILLTRTGRRRYIEQEKITRGHKPLHEPDNSKLYIDDTSTLVRRLSVIFSSVCHSVSMDYMVSIAGITILPESIVYHSSLSMTTAPVLSQQHVSPQISLLDAGAPENNQLSIGDLDQEEDEWESFWKEDDLKMAGHI